MRIVKSVSKWREIRKQIQDPIGFVPTMGSLHQGHMALIAKSMADNRLTVASVFVNPTQFNQPSDYEHYPRAIEDDMEKLKACGVDYCLMPPKNEMYPDGYTYHVTETDKSLNMEGQYRPGHFDGVLTIVLKLLMLVKPDNTYLGEKDYQQYQLIKHMVDAFFLETNIIACPTIREMSGLALSSRNARLSPSQKEKAETFAQCFHEGEDVDTIKQALKKANIKLDYLEERDERRFAAVWIDDIRLIDNYEIKRC